jgi:hypothetical protein
MDGAPGHFSASEFVSSGKVEHGKGAAGRVESLPRFCFLSRQEGGIWMVKENSDGFVIVFERTSGGL